jgi:membrane protein DedA with SNARE-associated domain
MALLLDLLNFIQPYGTWSYVIIFGVLLACGFGLPIPEDITLVVGGILAARGIIDFKACVALCMAGVLIGDGIVFTLGATMGNKIKNTKFGKFLLPEKRDAAVRKMVNKYGDKIIFMARFMPGFRTPLFFATGSYHVPFWKFLLLDGIAALISVPLWVWVGYWFGANLEQLESIIRRFQVGIYSVLALAIAATVGMIYLRRRITDTTLDV